MHTHICAHEHTHTGCLLTRTLACAHACACVHEHTQARMHTHAYTRAHTRTCTHTRMHAHTHTNGLTQAHMHGCTQTVCTVDVQEVICRHSEYIHDFLKDGAKYDHVISVLNHDLDEDEENAAKIRKARSRRPLGSRTGEQMPWWPDHQKIMAQRAERTFFSCSSDLSGVGDSKPQITSSFLSTVRFLHFCILYPEVYDSILIPESGCVI